MKKNAQNLSIYLSIYLSTYPSIYLYLSLTSSSELCQQLSHVEGNSEWIIYTWTYVGELASGESTYE